MLDALAITGLGALGIRALHAASVIRHAGARAEASASVVEEFGDWTDDIWRSSSASYECIAVRDRAMMNRLLPRTGWPGGMRLKIESRGRVVGWSVVHAKRMHNDARFGALYVAQISDCFASPGDAYDVIAATHAYVASLGVDLVCSNQSHPAWTDAFQKCGYLALPGRRIFAVSPQLQARMEPFETTVRGLHLTNMDGHGPHGFTEAD
jgi:hypothetical protein